jgi:hypothetical protein
MSAAAERIGSHRRGVRSTSETPRTKASRPVPRPCRRSDFDVTDTVQVSSPAAVREAVLELYADTWPGAPREPLEAALRDFESLFTGSMPGYLGVDTVYHDLQHSQDVVLAMARLLAGYERVPDGPRLGAERGLVALITALFHDAGYIRESGESGVANGAVFTRNHVTRSARFIAKYLPGAIVSDNVIVNGKSIPKNEIFVPARNALVDGFDAVGFVAWQTGNYRLAQNSKFKDKKIGCDIDALEAEIRKVQKK